MDSRRFWWLSVIAVLLIAYAVYAIVGSISAATDLWNFTLHVTNDLSSNAIFSGTVAAVLAGIILYVLFGRKKESPVITQNVQGGATVIQNIYLGEGNSPESSKRILEKIPDQLFVPQSRSRVRPVQPVASENLEGLIQKVAQNALGSGPLTPLVADALEIARTLNRDEESRWLQRELYGYERIPSDQPNTFPEYRRISGRIPIRLEAITTTGPHSEDVNVERILFVSFPVKRVEETASGARSRDAAELVFWIDTPEEFSELAREQNAQITSEHVGKTPFIAQIGDLERLLSELRLRIHRFVTAEGIQLRRS